MFKRLWTLLVVTLGFLSILVAVSMDIHALLEEGDFWSDALLVGASGGFLFIAYVFFLAAGAFKEDE